MRKFCPKCGKEASKLYEGLCETCFLEKWSVKELIPKSVTVHRCVDCQRYVAGSKLTFDFNEALERRLKKLFKEKSVEKVDYVAVGNKIELKVFLNKYGLRKVETFVIPFYEKKILCKFCNMKRTGYHNAVLQIIAPKDLHDKIESLVEEQVRIHSRKDDLAFISERIKDKHGMEFKIGSKSTAMRIAKMLKGKYGGNMKLSRKLVTRKKGRDLYRLTISLRVHS